MRAACWEEAVVDTSNREKEGCESELISGALRCMLWCRVWRSARGWHNVTKRTTWMRTCWFLNGV